MRFLLTLVAAANAAATSVEARPALLRTTVVNMKYSQAQMVESIRLANENLRLAEAEAEAEAKAYHEHVEHGTKRAAGGGWWRKDLVEEGPSTDSAVRPASMRERVQTLLHSPSRAALADVLHGPYPAGARPAYQRASLAAALSGIMFLHFRCLVQLLAQHATALAIHIAKSVAEDGLWKILPLVLTFPLYFPCIHDIF